MLTFLFPLGLVGLVSVPLVIALHLLRERQRNYVVSSLWLWKFLKPQIHGARYSRLPITWLLILDVLIAASLSAALASPQITSSIFSKPSVHQFFVLDASTSMLANEGMSSRFAKAKQEMVNKLLQLSGNDQATVIIFNHRAMLVGDTNNDSINQIIQRLDKVEVGGRGNAVMDALLMARAKFSLEKPNEIHLYSDGSYDLKAIPKEMKGILYHSMGSSSNNQAILQMETRVTSDNKLQVFAQLGNFSGEDVQRIISLLLDDNSVSSQKIELPANQVIKQTWTLENVEASKLKTVRLVLIGEDDLAADDEAYCGLYSGNKATVSLVSDQEYPLLRALQSFDGLNILYSTIAQYQPQLFADLYIYRGFVPSLLPSGKILLIEPRGMINRENQEQISLDARKIDLAPDDIPVILDQEKMKELDFSGVRWEKLWKLDTVPDGYKALISIKDHPLLLEGWEGSSQIYILLADFSSGNFHEHPSFIVLLGNLLFTSEQFGSEQQQRVGEPIHLPRPKQLYNAVTIILPDQTRETFRSKWDTTWNNTTVPGFYTVQLQSNTGKEMSYVIGVNAGDFQESDIKPQVVVESTALDLGKIKQEQQIDLTPWLLGAALILVMIEATLAWRR